MRPIPGRPGYFARRDGSIWSTVWGRSRENASSTFEPRQLRPIISYGTGYPFVWLKCPDGILRRCLIHRLVLLAFRGDPPRGHVGRHLDGTRTNNRLSNLRWGTPTENSRDKARHGTSGRGQPAYGRRGERHHNAKLTRADAQSILQRHLAGEMIGALAAEHGVCYMTIRNLVRRRTWLCLDEPEEINVCRGKYQRPSPNGPRRQRRVRQRQRFSPNQICGESHHATTLTAVDVRQIRRRRAEGEPAMQLAAEYRVTRATVYNIIARRTWSHIGE